MIFIAELGLDVELIPVDLLVGAHHDPVYLEINPNGLVPFLVDDDFSLGESSAILRYLADKFGARAYPSELKTRARVNEALDWFNTQFHECYCLFACYPHMGVPHGADPDLLKSLITYGEAHAGRWLTILDEHMLGDRAYVCGHEISLADYLGASFVRLGELGDFDLSPYRNIRRWLARLNARPHWDAGYAGFQGLVAAIRAPTQAAA
jgi:glutathione S-transferase